MGWVSVSVSVSVGFWDLGGGHITIYINNLYLYAMLSCLIGLLWSDGEASTLPPSGSDLWSDGYDAYFL